MIIHKIVRTYADGSPNEPKMPCPSLSVVSAAAPAVAAPPVTPQAVVRHVDIPGAKEPTIAEMAVNFTGAMVSWAKNGFPVVDKEEYERRALICAGCDKWDGDARMGLGICRAKGCGCTGFKRWLASESCVLKKW